MTKQIDVVVVYTAGSLLRVLVTGAAAKIMFEDLPYVDRIMEMIHVSSLPFFFFSFFFSLQLKYLNSGYLHRPGVQGLRA